MASTNDENQSLLDRVPPALKAPPMVLQPGVEQLSDTATIPDHAAIPPPAFARFRYDHEKRRLPQCISHRGYKAVWPENTLAAFKGAVDVGTHALETDVHTTKDEVVVISHDADLKRCFGRDEKIAESTWDEIKDARTTREPHEPLPRFKELLEYLAQPGLEEMWLLIDIKLSNDAETIMRCLASTIASVPPPAGKKWEEKLLLGIWAAKFLPFAVQYLDGFPITHIGFNLAYARHFFTVPNVSFNMLFPVLLAPGGQRFIRDAREHNRQVYAWTVNDEDKMEWCIRRQLDGVITDDPKKFLQVCEKFDWQKKESWFPISWRGYWDMLRVIIWVRIAVLIYRKRFLPVASKALIQRGGK